MTPTKVLVRLVAAFLTANVLTTGMSRVSCLSTLESVHSSKLPANFCWEGGESSQAGLEKGKNGQILPSS